MYHHAQHKPCNRIHANPQAQRDLNQSRQKETHDRRFYRELLLHIVQSPHIFCVRES